ncbi:MAG: 16S rRNA processing protein RimM [Candidatus Marinimicrobia bacterium]|nr:16S rRNA processing protein RimM [Candidatus Neomarinimicrobiota bacterium]
MSSEKLLYLGNVKKSHGVKGEILLTVNNENIKFTNDLKKVWLGEDPNHISSWEIENYRITNEKVFLKLRNVETPEEADFLKGLKAYLNVGTIEELSIHDTIGFQLIDDRTDDFISHIIGIEQNAMQDLVLFEHNGETKMIPVVEAFIRFIDWEKEKVYVELIEGLI